MQNERKNIYIFLAVRTLSICSWRDQTKKPRCLYISELSIIFQIDSIRMHRNPVENPFTWSVSEK